MLDQTLDQLVFEARYDCPVCIGLPMEKLPIALLHRTFTLDTCQRCEGVWFDLGEMSLAAEAKNSDLLQDGMVRIVSKPMQCHHCGMLMGRNLDHCPCCKWKNIIDCPVCDTELVRRSVGTLVIDTCSTCSGTWLDRVELPAVHYLSCKALTPQVLAIGDTQFIVPEVPAKGFDRDALELVLNSGELVLRSGEILEAVQGIFSVMAMVGKVSVVTVKTIAIIIAGLLGG